MVLIIADKHKIRNSVFERISSITGHTAEDLDNDMYLEGDLGLDSIKMVSIMSELMKLIPMEQAEDFTAKYPISSLMALQTVGDIVNIFEEWQSLKNDTADSQSMVQADSSLKNLNVMMESSESSIVSEKSKSDIMNIKNSVFERISSITGHTAEDLDNDMYLEGDLGLDSIKMVSVMSELMKLIPMEQAEDFTAKYPIASLMALQTVGDIVAIFEEWQISQTKTVQPVTEYIQTELKRSIDDPSNLEILHAQYPFLVTYWSVAKLTISSGVKIKGALNIQSLWASWKELIYRHPILRTVFKMDEEAKSFKDYSLELLQDVMPPDISIFDMRHLDVQTQQQTIKKRFESALNEKFNIFKWPLHNLSVLRTTDSEYEIFLSINHLISDGLGNQQILRELLEIYAAKVEGNQVKLPQAITGTEYNRIIEDINSWNNTEENEQLQIFLKEQGKDKYFFNPYNKKLKMEPFVEPVIGTKKYWFDEKMTERLILCAKTQRVSLFVLLVSAYLKTIKRQGEMGKKIILNLPTGGKTYPHVDATGVLGPFAQNLALSFYCEDANEGWETLISRVDDEIKGKLLSGIDRAQVNMAAFYAKEKLDLQKGRIPETTGAMIRATLKSNLYLSFVGDTEIKSQYGDFEVCDYEAYTGTNPGTIDTLIERFQGKLMITLNYDRSFFDEEYMNSHMSGFIQSLKDLAMLGGETRSVLPVTMTAARSDMAIASELCMLVEEICSRTVQTEDLYKDLDTELGMDSLQRIRFITRLVKKIGNINKNKLFSCRTLDEMVSVILDANDRPESNTQKFTDIPYLKIVEQCKNNPDLLAILFQNEQITYRDLDHLSNRLANYLLTKGIKSGSLVGIMTLPGPLMLTGMLGILKSGAAYVPIDPTYPAERIQYIINNSNIQTVMTEQVLMEQIGNLLLNNTKLRTFIYLDNGTYLDVPNTLEQIRKEDWMGYPSSDPKYSSAPDDLMTVLYTSGSTGNPKGVMLTHNGYMNRLDWHQKMFSIKSGDRVAQKTSCCFDISVWELFWPLMYGGTVCPVRKELVVNPWNLAKWMIDTRITVMHFVPSLFGEFVHALEDEAYAFRDLRWLIFSGEALPPAYIQKWIDKYGMSVGLANLYGPTEASIDVTYHIIDERPDGNSIPIGKSVDNVYIKILDENMKELPEGEIGELWIGGIQLAKGYLNNPQKKAEAFYTNPFPEIPGECLYRTGDLAAKRSDGSYEYHGRRDNQVKIRGFRIELGEIEAVLNNCSGVAEAAVIVIDSNSGQKQLIACLSGTRTDDKEIREMIGRKLPYYMLPHRIEWLNGLPKNSNGKLDRRALKDMVSDSGLVERETALPMEDILPLVPAQRWLMNYFDYPYRWTGYTKFLYKQPLDFQIFKKSISILTNRHQALRCVLLQRDSKWVQRILTEELSSNIDFYDGSDMGEKERNQAVEDLIASAIQQLSVDKWPLWKVFVIQYSKSLFEIVVVGHHLISDVITNQILFQEIWQIYGQLLSGSEEISLPAAKSYQDFVQIIEEKKKKNLPQYVDYWKEQFPPESDSFNVPADFNLGANDEGSTIFETFTVDKSTTSILLGKAKKYFECNVYNILLAPLYKMLADSYNHTNVIVSHRVHGRTLGENHNFFHTAGNFAVNFPMKVAIEKTDVWKKIVCNITEGLNGVPLNGVSYDLVSEHLPLYMYPDIKLTPVRANYLGNRDFPYRDNFEFPKDGMGRRYSFPQQKRISLLEFFFLINDGSLTLEIEYSKNLYRSSTIKQLGEQYLEYLHALLSSIEEPQPQTRLNSILVRSGEQSEGLLSNKVAIITGGGRGIGRSMALSLAKEGAQIAIISRTERELEETAAEIRGIGKQSLAIQADVSNKREVQEAVDRVIGVFGQIDVLVNNAGITKIASVLDMEQEEWEKIVKVNLFGTYYFCHSVIPHLIGRKQGKIINIGSDSSLIGYPLMNAYAASKHGVLGLTRSLAEELKPHNIQVNAICPALVDTDMAPAAFRNRAIPPEKVADSVIFLASSKSDYITGEAIKIYGKQDMYWFGSQQMPMLKAVLSKNQ